MWFRVSRIRVRTGTRLHQYRPQKSYSSEKPYVPIQPSMMYPPNVASGDDSVNGGRLSPNQAPASNSSNAFTEMMKPKPKTSPHQDKSPDRKTLRTTVHGRDGLRQYTDDPASFPQSRVVYYNDKFVVINDLFPKSIVHLLILPRDSKKNVMRPQEAFEDSQFLADCRAEEKKVRALVASELRRNLGRYSSSEQARIQAMDSDDPPNNLPPGRDWDHEVMSGTHANPSMNHLHIHVMSRDLNSECMKKRNHYLSFTTDFFIRMDEYPLAEDDTRRNYGHFPTDEMLCWRCGKNFVNKMARLKDHLAEEFEQWKRE